MQPREAFKVGFMARCVEEDLSAEKTAELMEKAAEPGILSTALSAFKDLAYPAMGLALAAPPAVGGLAAYFANRATDTDADDIEEIKQKELADSYRRMSRQMARDGRLRESKSEKKRTGRVFL